MTHITDHDLWTSPHTVVTLPPSRDDVLVVTTIEGLSETVHPVYRYDEALRTARAFVRRVQHPHPFVVKVLCLTLSEAVRMGFVVIPFEQRTPEQDMQDRDAVMTTLLDALRCSNEPQVRTDALATLKRIGAVQ